MRNALVISPFATTPLDAGHRRRVFQTTSALAEDGYRITFLLLAFEDAWYWSHRADMYDTLKRQWDEIVVVYAGSKISLPPKEGPHHELDEWWDANLENTLLNMCSRTYFDVAVVHNVWLSKAFDFLHPSTTKVLETHDLFWKRSEIYARMQIAPQFFVPSLGSEIFGIERADIAVAIQPDDALELLRRCRNEIHVVPFYDTMLQQASQPANAHSYIAGDKVSFGVLASANPFNIAGVNALLAALEDVIASDFAPIEMVIGGSVCAHVKTILPVKLLNRVDSEAVFYRNVDYALAPVFDGTGFKVKMADALALGMPVLISGHAAIGVTLDPAFICDSPIAMAARMSEISRGRPPLTDARAAVRRARSDLRSRTVIGLQTLRQTLTQASAPIVIDLSGATLENDPIILQSYFSMARVLARHGPVTYLVGTDIHELVAKYLPPGARTLQRDHADAWLAAADWRYLISVCTAAGSFGDAATHGDTRKIQYDKRWHQARSESSVTGLIFGLPAFHSDVEWEPAAAHLRRDWLSRIAKRAPSNGQALLMAAGPLRLIFLDFTGTVTAIGGKTATFAINAGDDEALDLAIMRILTARDVSEIVWSARPNFRHSAVLHLCALRNIPYWGPIEGAFVAAGVLRQGLAQQFDEDIDRQVREFLSRKALPTAATVKAKGARKNPLSFKR